MNKNDIIGTRVAQMHNGQVKIGIVKDLLKNENGSEYLNIQFDGSDTKLFPFPDIIAPKYNLRFRFVDKNVKKYVEQLFIEKHKVDKQNVQQFATDNDYIQKSKPNTDITVKEKQFFKYNTHAELLNYLLNKNYKAWMKSWHILNGSYAIWIISLDYQVRYGWRNRRTDDTIYENYVGKTINIDPLNYRNRLCFSIHNNGWQKIYIFEGVFKYIKTEKNTRIWQKISDNYTF